MFSKFWVICRLSSRVLLLAATIVALLIPRVSSSSVFLPGPAYSAGLASEPDLGLFQTSRPGQYTWGGVSVTMSAFPSPGMSGSVVGEPFPHDLSFTASFTYFFSVASPIPSDPILVPLSVAFHLQTQVINCDPFSFSFNSQANLDFFGGFAQQNVITSGCFSPPSDFRGLPSFSLAVDDVVGVRGFMKCKSTFAVGLCESSVDPYIFIDPAFLSSHPGYSVIVSAGVGNSPPAGAAVPEPAAWVLVGSGLAGIGLRRRARCEGRRTVP